MGCSCFPNKLVGLSLSDASLALKSTNNLSIQLFQEVASAAVQASQWPRQQGRMILHSARKRHSNGYLSGDRGMEESGSPFFPYDILSSELT